MSPGVSSILAYLHDPSGSHLNNTENHQHLSGRSAPPVILNVSHHFLASACASSVTFSKSSCLRPVMTKSVSSTYITAHNVIVTPVIAAAKVAFTGKAFIMLINTMLIHNHVGGPDPFPCPPPCKC